MSNEKICRDVKKVVSIVLEPPDESDRNEEFSLFLPLKELHILHGSFLKMINCHALVVHCDAIEWCENSLIDLNY